MGDIINIYPNKFKRPTAIVVDDTEFTDEVPRRRSSAAEPLKDENDIEHVIQYFIDNKAYRNLLLFVMGINFGLRCGDLLKLKIGHILNSDGSFKDKVVVREEKTNKIRTCYMNDSVMDAAEMYLSSMGRISLNAFLFTSLSNNCDDDYYSTVSSKEIGAAIEVRSVDRMLKKVINEQLGIDVHAGTHLMRKTFAYHVIMNAPDRTRAIEFLMKILGHSSASVTLAYAGITDDEIAATCRSLNLGKNIFYSSGVQMASAI